MAERRMFAKTIIDSDAFLDMPLSAQALYFHLAMRADDDGFINNPKKIQRMIGASDDDCKLLIAKGFILVFETGVIVIKHWKIHNYIQKDRYKETVFLQEKQLIESQDNGAYEMKAMPLLEEQTDKTARQLAYEKSSLPYSFGYKIRTAFLGKKCPICGCTMSYKNNLVQPTIQHNVPISKGGEHELGNISVICASCNKSLQDTETGKLNADEVVEEWDKLTCTRIGYDSDTQVRIGKVSIGKVNNIEPLNGVEKIPPDIEIEKEKDIEKESKPPKRFTAPSFEDVKAYCSERKNNVDAERFIDYYTANGWKVGKNPMKDWRAAVRSWERNDFGKPKTAETEHSFDLDDFFNSAVDKSRRQI